MVVVYQYPNYQLLLAENISEDKEFIQYGIPTDVWLRLENSAKSTPCYYRPSSPVSSLDELPPSVLRECALAIKSQANLKRDPIPLLYTFVSNINSNGPINQGEVSQHTVKTKQQTAPQVSAKRIKMDLEADKLEYDRATRTKNHKQFKQAKQVESENNRQYTEIAEQRRRGYTDLWDDDLRAAASNQNRAEDWEDDFM